MYHSIMRIKGCFLRVLTKDRQEFKYSSNSLFSFTYQQILSVANTIVADLETMFIRLVNRPKK